MTLPVSRLVRISVNLSPQAAVGRNFGDLLIVGDSNVISGLERLRPFATIDDVADAFGLEAPEYEAAALYFGQRPAPTFLHIGRWLRTATAAELDGAILNAAQAMLPNFTQMTSAGFNVTIDGSVHNLTGMNFSTALNLNGVASTIQAALSGAGFCTFNGSQFVITSATTGAGVKAVGSITLSGQPTASDTITVNGTVITFVAALTTGNQVLIGSDSQITAANLHAFLANSAISGIAQATYSIAGLVISIQYKSVGTAGNSFTLTESAANLVVSGATLTTGAAPSSVSYATSPGSGQDASSVLGLTAAMALPLVPGYDAETPVEAIAALAGISTAWYGSMFAASVMPDLAQNLDIAEFIEASSVTRMFGTTIQDTGVLSALVTNDLASQLKALGYEQTFCQYSSSNPYAVASIFGRAFSVNFEGVNTTITLMYKQEPGVVAETISSDQANTLEFKRCNVYAKYNNDTNIIQYGVMSGPAYIDEIHGLDWLQNATETALFNVMYTTLTKVPQTDTGDEQFVNAISDVCSTGIQNGLGAPGVWGGPAFGQLSQGQYLKSGFYIYAQPVALQSQSDREARKAPPFTVAFKLAGANQEVDVLMDVNR